MTATRAGAPVWAGLGATVAGTMKTRPTRSTASALPDDYGGLMRWLLAEAMARPTYAAQWLDMLAECAEELGERIEDAKEG